VQVVEGADEGADPTVRFPAAATRGSFDSGALQPGSTEVSVTTTVRWAFR
jgi:hypothetical protein